MHLRMGALAGLLEGLVASEGCCYQPNQEDLCHPGPSSAVACYGGVDGVLSRDPL